MNIYIIPSRQGTWTCTLFHVPVCMALNIAGHGLDVYRTPQAYDKPGKGPECCEGEWPVPLPARGQHLLQKLQNGLKGTVKGVQRTTRHPAVVNVRLVTASCAFTDCLMLF